MKRIARAAIVIVCVALPVGSMTAAGAAKTPTLASLAGTHVTNAFASFSSRDGSCPDSNDSGAPFEDRHQVFHASIVKPKYFEELGINICWLNSGAIGGDEVDTGTWELSIPTGSVKGTVSGLVGFGRLDDDAFTLTIVSGSGSLSGVTGHLDFWGCGDEASAFVASGLRTTPKPRLPAACTNA